MRRAVQPPKTKPKVFLRTPHVHLPIRGAGGNSLGADGRPRLSLTGPDRMSEGSAPRASGPPPFPLRRPILAGPPSSGERRIGPSAASSGAGGCGTRCYRPPWIPVLCGIATSRGSHPGRNRTEQGTSIRLVATRVGPPRGTRSEALREGRVLSHFLGVIVKSRVTAIQDERGHGRQIHPCTDRRDSTR